MIARSTEPRFARIVWPRLSVRGILNRLVLADATYRQRMQLKSMDDRMLRDIGVTRAEVQAELKRPIPW